MLDETCCAWGGYMSLGLWMTICSAPRTKHKFQ